MTDLLAVRDLRISFQLPTPDALIEAVRGISFTVPAGQGTALVGESGSGKSVISQAVMGILPRYGAVAGAILFCDPERGRVPPIDPRSCRATAPRSGDPRRPHLDRSFRSR